MAATPLTNDTFAFLKKYYIDGKMLWALDDYQTPLLSSVLKKDNNAGGSSWEQNVEVAAPQGGASDYATMYSNSRAGTYGTFTGNYKKRFYDIQIQDFTLRSAKGPNAVKEAGRTAIDGMRRQFNQALNFHLYRTEPGVIGQLDTSVADGSNSLTFTPATRSGIRYVKKGMRLAFESTANGSNASGSVLVTGRSANTYTMTVEDTANATGSHYVYDAGYTGAKSAPAGLQSWCPLTDALANTTFKGVDRTQDTTGLGGIRISGLGESVEESLIDAVAVARDEGSEPDFCLIHPLKAAQLRKEMKDRLVYTEVQGRAMVGGKNVPMIRGLVLDCGGKPVTVVEDGHCQFNATWIIESKKMQLLSIGQCPFPPEDNKDLMGMGRLKGTDYWQSELFGYVEFVPASPKAILVISHDAAI